MTTPAVVGVKQSTSPDRYIDTELVVNELGETVYRQRVGGQVIIQDPIAYFASAAGGRVAFNCSTGVVTIASSGEQPLAAIRNPTGSGKDVYVDLGEFGSSANTTFKRYRNPTLNITGAKQTSSNMGGGSATAALEMYIPANYTRTGGTVAKTAHIGAYSQYVTEIKGRVVIRPGQAIAWTIEGPGGMGGSMTASVYFEWYERPSE